MLKKRVISLKSCKAGFMKGDLESRNIQGLAFFYRLLISLPYRQSLRQNFRHFREKRVDNRKNKINFTQKQIECKSKHYTYSPTG